MPAGNADYPRPIDEIREITVVLTDILINCRGFATGIIIISEKTATCIMMSSLGLIWLTGMA